MAYKVTALKDVTIRAFVHGSMEQRLDNATIPRPVEREEWVELHAGQTKEGVGHVLGVHPQHLPGHAAVDFDGVVMVLPGSWTSRLLPMEFFGLYRLEKYRERL